MGVDIATYRMRIGSFGPRLGKSDVGSVGISTTSLVILIGALVFIRQLLLIAGVESNPGPAGVEFTFRYQYLLIEIGTSVLRKVFDHLVLNDFCQFLNINQSEEQRLKFLFLKNIINPEQQQVLPPIDTKPTSTNYDITLLCCLLRNVCGLRPHNNNSWINPTATDNSLEANICRLRECRNELMHSGSVFGSKVDLDAKWKHLSQILYSLNTACKIPNLTSMINEAEKMDIDEALRKHYDLVLQVWKNSDHFEELIIGQAQLEEGQSKLIKGQTQISDGNTQIKEGQSQLKKGQTHLKSDHLLLISGQSLIKDRQKELVQGQIQLLQGQSNLSLSQTQIQSGQSQLHQDISDLKQDIPVLKTGLKTMKRHVKDYKDTIQELNRNQKRTDTRLENIGKTLDDCKRRKLDINKSDIRDRLIKIYKEECTTLPVLPLCDGDEDEKELLSFYKPPSLWHKPYHRSQTKEDKYLISSLKDIFHKGETRFRKVYLTGDAGVGKTSLCQRMTLLWCKAKSGETAGDKDVQDDINFMAQFEFLFYVSLSVAQCTDIVSIIAEQLFYNVNGHKKDLIENILEKNECIIIMDALDEFNESGKININRLLSEKCVFMITCRPYKIENERLSPKEIDRQVQITGIIDNSIWPHISDIVRRMNSISGDRKKPHEFLRAVIDCGLYEHLHIPIIGSHLVGLWFDHGLTHMSKAVIYSNIIDMLFERAEVVKRVELPPPADCNVQFPNSLSNMFYLKRNVSLLNKIGLVAFNLLFKQDKDLSTLVFTAEQLEFEPYFMSGKEIDFLCRFGILSKSKVIGRFGKREQKLSFLHKTYLEYFTALFVTLFDNANAFDEIVKTWTSINDVVKYETFFLLFYGLSCSKTLVLNQLFAALSDEISLCRTNAIFHQNRYFYCDQLKALQLMAIDFFKDARRYNDHNMPWKLEDFVFDQIISTWDFLSENADSTVVKKELLLLNSGGVKFVHSVRGNYFDEFDRLSTLQCLHIGNDLNGYVYDPRFNMCMFKNKATLHTVCIEAPCCYDSHTVISGLPVSELRCMTSLSLCNVKLEHDTYQNLIKHLTDNVQFQNIKLCSIKCDCNCTFSLNLCHHSKLNLLCLHDVNIVCSNVNNSSLKSVTLIPLSASVTSCFNDLLNGIKSSKVEHFHISGGNVSLFGNKTIETLASTVKTLAKIKSLTLCKIAFPDDTFLTVHSNEAHGEIKLESVTMSQECFQSFIGSFVSKSSEMTIKLRLCTIRVARGGSFKELSRMESVDFMYNRLKHIPRVHIIEKDLWRIDFETKG